MPLGIAISGANVPDAHLLNLTIEAIVVERPEPTKEEPQNLSLDKGFDNPTGEKAVAGHHYIGHIRRIGEEKLDADGEKSIQRGVGWSNARLVGLLLAERSWFAMTEKPAIIWRY